MKPNYFSITANLKEREATVLIYGAIGGLNMDTWEIENTSRQFQKEFNAATENADTIHVRINSPGGSVIEGLAIYNTIFGSKKKVITYNDGLAASMGAYILLAGDEIHAYRNSLLMIHPSSGGFFGTVKEAEEAIEAQKKVDNSLSTIIEDRLGISKEEVSEKYLNYKDNFFNADEAKEIGFVDVIIQKDAAKLPEGIQASSAKQRFMKYAAFSAKTPNFNPKPNKMNKPNSFPNLQAALGLDQPLASTEEGSYINEDQKSLIENQITGLKSSLKTLRDEKAGELKVIQDEKSQLEATLTEKKDALTKREGELKALATLAGVEDLKEEATAEEVLTALNAKVAELNKKPGAAHTGKPADPKADEDKPHAYLDMNASIYEDYNKLKKQ